MAKHVPQRMCEICREMKSKSELIRLVRQDEVVTVDPSGRKPGRGLYLCLNEETIDQLFQPKRLEKLLRSKIASEDRLALETELRQLAAVRAAETARMNRPEIVTFDDEGRRVRRVTPKDS